MREVPKIWHAIWIGSTLPDEYKQNIMSWIKHNPEYKFNLYIDSATLPLTPKNSDLSEPDIPSNAIPAMQEFCDEHKITLHDVAKIPQCQLFLQQSFYNDWCTGEDKVYAFAADVLRLCILYVYGGLYTDVDVRCSGPIGKISNKPGMLLPVAGEGEKARIYDNWLIACMPKEKVMLKCLVKYYISYNQTVISAKRIPKTGAWINHVSKPSEQSYETGDHNNLRAYYIYRKKIPHNLSTRLDTFGFPIFLQAVSEYLNQSFGTGIIAQIGIYKGQQLEHYESRTWGATKSVVKIFDNNLNCMTQELLNLRMGVA